MIKGIPDIWVYLPDHAEGKTYSTPRDFVFNIINTLDKDFFPEALQ
jgi:hypothetical protein